MRICHVCVILVLASTQIFSQKQYFLSCKKVVALSTLMCCLLDMDVFLCVWALIILWWQVLPIFPRLVDLPLEKFQMALAHILQVNVNAPSVILQTMPYLIVSFFFFSFFFLNIWKRSSIIHYCNIMRALLFSTYQWTPWHVGLFVGVGSSHIWNLFSLHIPMLFYQSNREGKQSIPHSFVILSF